MTPATSLGVLLAFLQADSTAQGIAEFNRGDFKAARQHLQQSPSDPQAAVFFALTRAATGECEGVMPELERRFASSVAGPQAKVLHRLEGLALAQCQISSKRFGAAGTV